MDVLGALVSRRKDLGAERDKLRAEANRLAKRNGRATDAEREAAIGQAKQIRERVRQLDEEHQAADRELADFLLALPNVPADEAPEGNREEDAVELRRSGEPVVPEYPLLDHSAYGERTGLIDMPRAARLSGARFAVTSGALAAVQRALVSFLIDLHLAQGYVEYTVPSLVTRQTMTGTGQLPKFEDDLFRTEVGGRELFLIPTAEVPLVNLYANETLPAARLPVAVTAYTPCFRGEAGSYGRDTKGIFRVHEFAKVEMVRICRAPDSRAELDLLVSHAEECLRRLELSYRVVSLAAGDLGFSARLTYDIEVWLPSQRRYREISSCSDCGRFQARRAGIKVKDADGKAPAATLNGSGLPIGRTLIALLEQHQEADGAVRIPDALAAYTGFHRIRADGSIER